MAAKRLNKKLLGILSLVVMTVVVVGVILVVRYKYRDPEPFMAEGRALAKEARQLEAEIESEVSQISDPEEAYNRRVELEGEKSLPKWMESRDQFAKAVNYASSNRALGREALDELSQLYLHINEYGGAIQVWDEMTKWNPADYEPRRKQADFYYELAQNSHRSQWHSVWEEVRSRADKLIELKEDDWYGYAIKAHANIMIIHAQATQNPESVIKEAEELLAKTYALNAEGVLVNKIRAFMELLKANKEQDKNQQDNLWQQAEGYLREAIAKNPDDPQAYMNLFDAYQYPMVARKLRAMREAARAGAEAEAAGAAVIAAEAKAKSEELKTELQAFTEACLKELKEAGDRFADHGEFFVAEAQLRSRTAKISEISELIGLYEKAVGCANAKAQWYLELGSMYYRAVELGQKQEGGLERALEVLRHALYLPEVTDTKSPRNLTARNVRFGIVQMLAEVGIVLADQSEDEATKKDYLSISKWAAKELSEQVGEDNHRSKIIRGSIALAEGRYEEGVRLLYQADEQLTVQGISNGRLKMKLFRALRDTEYHSLAVQYVVQALNKSGVRSPSVVLEYAKAALKMPSDRNMLESLVQTIESLLLLQGTESENYDDLMAMKANALLRLGRREEAAKTLAETRSQSLELRLLRAKSQETMESQIAALEDITRDEPGSPEAVQILVGYYMSQGKQDRSYYDKASALVDRALEVNPQVTALRQVKRLLAEPDPNQISPQRQQELMLADLKEIIDPLEREKQLGRYYRERAEIARSQGDNESEQKYRDESKAHLEAAQRIKPDEVPVLSALFDLAIAEDDLAEAERLVGVVNEYNPAQSLLLEGHLKMAQKQWVDSVDRLERFLLLQPISIKGHMNLAQVYVQLERHEDALREAKIAVQQGPYDGASNRLLAVLLHDRNVREGLDKIELTSIHEIMRPMEKVLRVAPRDPVMHQLQVIYFSLLTEHGRNQLATDRRLNDSDREKLSKVIEMREQATVKACRYLIERDRSNMRNWQMLANVYYQRIIGADNEDEKAHWQSAVQGIYEEALKVNPGSPELSGAYANFLQQVGKSTVAEELMVEQVAQATGDARQDARFLLSNIYRRGNNMARAQEVLEEILAEDARHQRAMIALAELYTVQGDYDKAIEWYEQARGIKESIQVLAREAVIMLRAGRVDDSDVIVAQMKEKYPEAVETLLIQGELELRKTNYAAAVAYSDRVLEKNPSVAGAYLLKGEALLYDRKLSKALDCINELRSKQASNNNIGRLLLARIYRALYRYSEEINELETALQLEPGSAEIRQALIRSLDRRGRWKELEDLYADTLKLYPKSVQLWAEAGDVALRFGDEQMKNRRQRQAQQQYQKGLGLMRQAWHVAQQTGRNEPPAFLGLWRALRTVGAAEEMQRLVNEVLEREPEDSLLWAHKAEALYALGKKQDALSTFEKALELASKSSDESDRVLAFALRVGKPDELLVWGNAKLAARPEWVSMHMLMAALYRAKQDYREEIKSLRSAMTHAEEGLAWRIENYLWVAHEQAGDKNEAIACYRRILEREPDNADILNNLAYSLLGQTGHLEEAVELAKKAYELAGTNPRIMDTYAVALLRKKDYERAEFILRRVLQEERRQQGEVTPDHKYHLAQALAGQGQNEQAWDTMKRVLDDLKEAEDSAANESLRAEIIQMMEQMSGK